MKSHHICARHEIRPDKALEIECIGKDEGLDVTSLFGFSSVLSLHLGTPPTVVWYIAQSKMKSEEKFDPYQLAKSWVLPTLVGRAGAVLGFSGSAKISAC